MSATATNFLPTELEVFDRYLKDGGRILLFADPAFQPGATAVAELHIGFARRTAEEAHRAAVDDPDIAGGCPVGIETAVAQLGKGVACEHWQIAPGKALGTTF